MQIIKINPKNPSLKVIRFAARVIKKGGVVIYPTDTIYGVGADALDQSAIDKVYKIKERPASKPLSVVVNGIKMAKKYCVVGKKQEQIFSALLPGAFTLIFPARIFKKDRILTVFKRSLSVRIPDHKITLMLSKELGIPFTATSANISGLSGSGDIGKVLKQLEKKKNLVDLVLDAGVLPERNSSIIFDLTGKEPKVARK